MALPAPMRKRYAERLKQRLAPGCEMLLVTLEFQAEDGPPFAVNECEVRRLFEPAFVVERMATGEPYSSKRGERREIVYRLP